MPPAPRASRRVRAAARVRGRPRLCPWYDRGQAPVILRVAGLDVVIGDGIEEVALVITHQVVYPAARGQSLVAVGVRQNK